LRTQRRTIAAAENSYPHLRTGNEGSDAWRVGGFAQIKFEKTPLDITVSAGQHNNDESGIFANKNGPYASVSLGLSF
jgi:hypothetical protein